MPTQIEIGGKKRNLAWRPDKPDHRDLMMKMSFFKKLSLARYVDLTPKCPRVEDQSTLGSCTANASTSAMEYLAKKMAYSQMELSRLYVYWWTRYIEKTPPDEDPGAELRNVMKALAVYGACSEALWPYNIDKFHVQPDSKAGADGVKRKIVRYFRCPTLAYIKLSLAQDFPVVGGFAVPSSMDSMETSNTGVVLYPGPNDAIVGGHAILFVGYDDGKQRLKFQNSWGTGWGDKGYGYLPYRYVNDGLAMDFWTIRAESWG